MITINIINNDHDHDIDHGKDHHEPHHHNDLNVIVIAGNSGGKIMENLGIRHCKKGWGIHIGRKFSSLRKIHDNDNNDDDDDDDDDDCRTTLEQDDGTMY